MPLAPPPPNLQTHARPAWNRGARTKSLLPRPSAAQNPTLVTKTTAPHGPPNLRPLKPPPDPPILRLSNELLLSISSYIPDLWTLNLFLRTNKRLYALLLPLFYRRSHQAPHERNQLSRSEPWRVPLYYRSFLHQTAANGTDLKLLRGLLKNGGWGFVNSRDTSGLTPLASALLWNRVSCVRLLLDHGADANMEMMGNGWWPVHVAAYCGYAECLELLAQHEADLNIQVANPLDKPHTALFWALYFDRAEEARVLIASGCRLEDGHTDDGMTALGLARALGRGAERLMMAKGVSDLGTLHSPANAGMGMVKYALATMRELRGAPRAGLTEIVKKEKEVSGKC